MPTLLLCRTPLALFLERVIVPAFFVLLALTFGIAAWWYGATEYAPQFAVIALFTGAAVAMLGVAWAFAKYTPWRIAIKVSAKGAITVVTTRGETTVAAEHAYGVTVVRYGIALKYRHADGHDAWLGIDSNYVDEKGTRLSGAALIDRINAAISPKALNYGRTGRAMNQKFLRVLLVLLGILIIIVGIVSVLNAKFGI